MSVTNEILRSAVGLTDLSNKPSNEMTEKSLRPGSKEYIQMVRHLRRAQSIRNLKAKEREIKEASPISGKFLSDFRRRMKNLTIKEDELNEEKKTATPATAPPQVRTVESPLTPSSGGAAGVPAPEELKAIVSEPPFRWNDGEYAGYHLLSMNDLALHLDSMFGDGLTSAEANRRLLLVGPNEPSSEAKPPLWKLFLAQFTNIIVLMLIAASIVALSLSVYVEGVAILVIIILNAIVAVYTEHSSASALEELMALSQPLCSILRDGEERTLPARLLVPGDLVLLKAGDIIPADGRLVQTTSDFTVNEFLLTTESGEVKKAAADLRRDDEDESSSGSHIVETGTPSNMAFASTSVTSGNARLLVVTTGMSTRVSALAQMLQDSKKSEAAESSQVDAEDGGKEVTTKQSRATRASSAAPGPVKSKATRQKKKTPLQRDVDRLAIMMGMIAIIGSALVFLAGTVRGQKDPNNPDSPAWLNMLLIAVSLAVSCIPEALPLIVTLCLTMGAKHLGKLHALVRQLSVLEALGSVDVICLDKTATLTEGKMTVVKMIASLQDYDVTGKGVSPEGKIMWNGLSVMEGEDTDLAAQTTLLSGLLCSNASIQKTKAGAWQGLGSATEIAIVVAAAKMSIEREESFRQYPRVEQLPFSADRKMMITVHRLPPPQMNDDDVVVADRKAKPSPKSKSRSVKARTPAPLQQPQPFSFPQPKTQAQAGIDPAPANADDDDAETYVSFGDLSLSSEYKYVCCVKGAAEEVLKTCAAMVMQSGKIESLTAAARKDIQDNMERLAEEAFRLIGVAFKPLEELPHSMRPTVELNVQKLPEKSNAAEPKSTASMSRLLSGDVVAELANAASAASASVAASSGVPPRSSSNQLFETEKKFLSVTSDKDLIFCGVLCCIDPERDGAQRAVELCKEAGIRVVMFTGDFRGTAVAIARNSGILPLGSNLNVDTADCSVLRPKGKYLGQFDLDEITQRVSVFSRAKPEDKQIIVQSLQRQGRICAVAGDGVNDVSALRQARIAVSMGASLSVVKQASKLVLADDNIGSVVDAIRAGRGVTGNLQKFVLYMFAVNPAQIVVIFLCALIGFPSPFAPLQILFMNLVTDCLPALALTVQPEEEEMNEPPRSEKDPVIRGKRVVMIIAHMISLIIALLLAFLVGLYWHTGKLTLSALFPDNVADDELTCSVMDSSGTWTQETGRDCVTNGINAATTMSFITIMLAEMIRIWVVRHYINNIFSAPLSNPTLIVATVLCLGLMLLVTLTPGVQDVFSTANLQYHAWLLCVGCALFPAVIDECIKLNYRTSLENEQQWKAMKDGFSSVLSELRAIRKHMDKVDQLLLIAQPEKEREQAARLKGKIFSDEEEEKVKKQLRGGKNRTRTNYQTLHPRLLASATASAASSASASASAAAASASASSSSSSSSAMPNESPSVSPSMSISVQPPSNSFANAIINAKTVPPPSLLQSRVTLSDLQRIQDMINSTMRNDTMQQDSKQTQLDRPNEEIDPLNWHDFDDEQHI